MSSPCSSELLQQDTCAFVRILLGNLVLHNVLCIASEKYPTQTSLRGASPTKMAACVKAAVFVCTPDTSDANLAGVGFTQLTPWRRVIFFYYLSNEIYFIGIIGIYSNPTNGRKVCNAGNCLLQLENSKHPPGINVLGRGTERLELLLAKPRNHPASFLCSDE